MNIQSNRKPAANKRKHDAHSVDKAVLKLSSIDSGIRSTPLLARRRIVHSSQRGGVVTPNVIRHCVAYLSQAKEDT